jgi:hypothetical protein
LRAVRLFDVADESILDQRWRINLWHMATYADMARVIEFFGGRNKMAIAQLG